MKVAYVFSHPRCGTYKLGKMILPQLEVGVHGVEVIGMFFFDDNCYVLRKGDPIGERLAKVAQAQNILLMMCDMCALERNLAEGKPRWCNPDSTGRKDPSKCMVKDVVEGVTVGFFPDLYTALSGNLPDQVITL